MKNFLLSLLFLPLFAWSATLMKSDLDGNPLLIQYSEAGFIDCVFRIVERSEADGRYGLRLRASYAGQVVGMDVVVVKNIQGSIDSNMDLNKDHVYKHGVAFLRTGPESDKLVSALAAPYKQKVTERKMATEESYTAIALHQGSLDMEREPVKIKIFGRDGEPFDEEAYYESFFNLDLKHGFVFWNEKDQSYREALIRGLTH